MMAGAAPLVRRIPLSTSVLYILAGYIAGPTQLNIIRIDLFHDVYPIRLAAEIALLISLFSAGLKLRLRFFDIRWKTPLILALPAMILTIGGLAATGHFALGFPLGYALLLGALLAPTDPVLASDVQVERPYEFNELRFNLTAEAGFNDGAAMPFFALALGTIGGIADFNPLGWHWALVDFVWGIGGGILIGSLLGGAFGRWVLHLREKHNQAVGTENFLAAGLVCLTYGIAELTHALGFVAVFCAAIALRRVELRRGTDEPDQQKIQILLGSPSGDQEVATDPDRAAAYMLHRLVLFSEQVERIAELGIVTLVGAFVRLEMFTWENVGIALLLFFVLRPLSVHLCLLRSGIPVLERSVIAWFGIRGIGSVYYVCYAAALPLAAGIVHRLVSAVLVAIVASIVLHGISVTPVINWYSRQQEQSS